MRYGLPYMGSKNQIAEEIIKYLPSGKRLVDLFGGGGAISHCASISPKWDGVLYNELSPLVFKAFKMAINGEFENENRWICRENFFKLRETDPYAAFCFSFSNNLTDYAYSKELEPIKKALHYSMVFGDDSLLKKIKIDPRKRKEYLESYARLQSMCALARMKDLSGCEIELSNDTYLNYVYKGGDVVYCDPPYESTCCKSYKGFDSEEFYNWVESRDYTVYFSSYEMPKLNERFYKAWEQDKRVTVGDNNALLKRECIYTNKKTDHVSLIPEQLMLF